MFCKNCGKELADDDKFCQFCGTKTAVAVDFNVLKKIVKDEVGKAGEIGGGLINKAGNLINNASDKSMKEQPSVDVEQLGALVRSCLANMTYQNDVGKTTGLNKGGKLYLYEKGICFKAHALNIGDKEYVVEYKDIAKAEVMHGIRHLVSTINQNFIQVTTYDGITYEFLVPSKEKQELVDIINEFISPYNTEREALTDSPDNCEVEADTDILDIDDNSENVNIDVIDENTDDGEEGLDLSALL